MKRKRWIRRDWAYIALLPSIHAYCADTTDTAARDAIVAHYRNGADPVIEAAEWTGNVFNVGIHYMGSNENGLANTVCKVVASHGMSGDVRVRVVDINSMGGDQKRWETIGQSTCITSASASSD